MSASLTQLRKLSDSTAQLLMTDVSSEHVAARATRMLALSRAVDEVDTTTDVTDVMNWIAGVRQRARRAQNVDTLKLSAV